MHQIEETEHGIEALEKVKNLLINANEVEKRVIVNEYIDRIEVDVMPDGTPCGRLILKTWLLTLNQFAGRCSNRSAPLRGACLDVHSKVKGTARKLTDRALLTPHRRKTIFFTLVNSPAVSL